MTRWLIFLKQVRLPLPSLALFLLYLTRGLGTESELKTFRQLQRCTGHVLSAE
jgi:hypothetical protein